MLATQFTPKYSIQDRFYITSGNFHADSTQERTIHQAANCFDYGGVYRTFSSVDGDIDTYKKQVQQEFVVKDEISIFDYSSLQIICENSADAKSLLNKLADPEKWSDKILVGDGNCYMNHNPFIRIWHSENTVSVGLSTTSSVIGKIKLVVDDGSFICTNSGKVINETSKSIIVLDSLDVEISDSTISFSVQWIDRDEKIWDIYRHRSHPEKMQRM